MPIEYQFKGFDYVVECSTCGKLIAKGNTLEDIKYPIRAMCRDCGLIMCHSCYDEMGKKNKMYKRRAKDQRLKCPVCLEEELIVKRNKLGIAVDRAIDIDRKI